jgi:glutamate N-acetyltransferase / amino-acid N-acetyltransferase
MVHKISPLATSFPQMQAISGVELFTTCSGMRYKNRDDILVAIMTQDTSVAGVFTLNKIAGEPIKYCREILPKGKARALVVNAGYSNVYTGNSGMDIVQATSQKMAEKLNCSTDEVYIASTGIIGQLPDKAKLLTSLDAVEKADFLTATKAINTTDTFAKGATTTALIGGKKVTINGFIKGSGMIAPNMATMLGFVFTDANVPSSKLQAMLSKTVETTYNAITVDSDTSTSDTILVFATGTAGNDPNADLSDFEAKLHQLHLDLAKLVIQDGEGATKFVAIAVKNAASTLQAKATAMEIANSPLVKTALSAGDANWGRIFAAAGKAPFEINPDIIKLWIGDELVTSPNYVEDNASKHLSGEEVSITLDLGLGDSEFTAYTCDLSAEYVAINADYRS